MLWRTFCWQGLAPTIQYKVILTGYHNLLKHFFPDGSNLFQDDCVLSEEYENDVNHILGPS